MKRRKKVSGAEQTRESWRYPGDKLNRNLLGRVEGLVPPTAHRCERSRPCLDATIVTFDSSLFYTLMLPKAVNLISLQQQIQTRNISMVNASVQYIFLSRHIESKLLTVMKVQIHLTCNISVKVRPRQTRCMECGSVICLVWSGARSASTAAGDRPPMMFQASRKLYERL